MEPGRSVEWASDAPCSEILEPSRQQPLSMGRTSSETLLPSEKGLFLPRNRPSRGVHGGLGSRRQRLAFQGTSSRT